MPRKKCALTDKQIEIAAEVIASGGTQKRAALRAGISPSAFYTYIRIATALEREDKKPSTSREKMSVKLKKAVDIAEEQFCEELENCAIAYAKSAKSTRDILEILKLLKSARYKNTIAVEVSAGLSLAERIEQALGDDPRKALGLDD